MSDISDPYLSTSRCIERLLTEYQVHKKLIVAVDFDDTVFDFHKAGFQYDHVIYLLKRCQNLGFHVVMFTGSHPDGWPAATEYLAEMGIEIKFINVNPIPLPFGNHGKMYYNILLDDRAGLGQSFEILSRVVTHIETENPS